MVRAFASSRSASVVCARRHASSSGPAGMGMEPLLPSGKGLGGLESRGEAGLGRPLLVGMAAAVALGEM